MRLLANENIPLQSIIYLEQKGFDIKAIGKDFRGILDQEVVQLSIDEHRTILTLDSNYGELIFKCWKSEKGVVFPLSGLYLYKSQQSRLYLLPINNPQESRNINVGTLSNHTSFSKLNINEREFSYRTKPAKILDPRCET